MFICQIIASRGNGGLEKHVRELSVSLVEQGHRVLVIGDPLFIKTLPACIERVSLNMRMSRHHPWLLFKLFMHLRQHQFDVIHAQANKAASMLASLKGYLKVPTVATIHNMKNHVGVFRQYAHVICVSRHLAQLVNTKGVEIIYNGIQAPIMNKVDLKADYDLPLNKPVICAVGRLVSAKGFDVLLEAIDGIDVSLLIVGDGPQKSELESRMMHMHANTHVCLIGHHDNPSNLMHATDGIVISSRREGFSYVLSEALMSGANILSTDVPVANEVLPDALIVPVDDAVMLRKKLQTLLKTPSDWAALMQKAQVFAQQEMTIKQMTTKTIDLYQQLGKPV
jgi:glycosyltransferase involved in cell wall biosynthesis